MTTTDDLLSLERAGWTALSTAGAARGFYAEVLADSVLFLLPGGFVIDDRTAVIESMEGPPWTSFELADERVHLLTDRSAVVAYLARARRETVEYEALVSSTYVLTDSTWHLAVHQQTPIAMPTARAGR